MAGYTIMIKEIIDQIKDNSFTHVFLQAGVGGMAAAMIAGFAKFSIIFQNLLSLNQKMQIVFLKV